MNDWCDTGLDTSMAAVKIRCQGRIRGWRMRRRDRQRRVCGTAQEMGWGWDIFNQSVAYDFRRICVWPSGWRHRIAWYVYCICRSPKSGGHRSSGHNNQSISTPTPTSLSLPCPSYPSPKAAPRRSGNVGGILGNQTTTTASPGSSPWKSLSPSLVGLGGGWLVGPFSLVLL